MISAIDNTLTALSAGQGNSTSDSTGTGFDAALDAAQKAQARQQAHEDEMATIRDKGFTAWARDTRIEKLKEELRKKVMAEMGLDSDSLSKMESAVQQILKQKIEEEVDKRLEQSLAEEDQGNGTTTAGQQTANAQNQQSDSGKKFQGGISCPVIPALMEAGGESLF